MKSRRGIAMGKNESHENYSSESEQKEKKV